MFGLGAMEVVVILLLALIVLGPEKLPEVARKMARFTGELRRVSDEVRRNFDEASRDMEDLRKPLDQQRPAARPAPQQAIAQHAPLVEAAARAQKEADEKAGFVKTDPHANCTHEKDVPHTAAHEGHAYVPPQPMPVGTEVATAPPQAHEEGDEPKGHGRG